MLIQVSTGIPLGIQFLQHNNITKTLTKHRLISFSIFSRKVILMLCRNLLSECLNKTFLLLPLFERHRLLSGRVKGKQLWNFQVCMPSMSKMVFSENQTTGQLEKAVILDRVSLDASSLRYYNSFIRTLNMTYDSIGVCT